MAPGAQLDEGILDENFVSLVEDAGEELLPEILDLYISDGEETIKELLKACEGGDEDKCDLEEVQKLIHRLKGSSLNIGAAQICETCKAVRQLCVDSKPRETRETLVEMSATFEKVKESLRWYLSSMGRRKRLKTDDASDANR